MTDRIDVGAYLAKSPGANYGFWGGQIQYNFVNDSVKQWAASAHLSFVSLYGPDDFDLTVYGLDLVASKEFPLFSNRTSVTAYAGASTYVSISHETTAAVSLKDENILGVQGMVGVVAHISIAGLAVVSNFAAVNSLSFKVGVGF